MLFRTPSSQGIYRFPNCHLRTFILPSNLTWYCHSWVNPDDLGQWLKIGLFIKETITILAIYDSIGFLQIKGAPSLGEAPLIGRLRYVHIMNAWYITFIPSLLGTRGTTFTVTGTNFHPTTPKHNKLLLRNDKSYVIVEADSCSTTTCTYTLGAATAGIYTAKYVLYIRTWQMNGAWGWTGSLFFHWPLMCTNGDRGRQE